MIYFGYKKTKSKWSEIFPIKFPDFIITISIGIFSIGLVIICSEIDNIFRYFVSVPDFFYELTADLFDPKYILSSFLVLCIVAPLSEELMFRGLLLKGFLQNYSKINSIILTALLFSIMHLNPLQFFGTFIFGILAAIILIKTENLFLTIYFHAIFNFLPWFVINFTNLKIKGFSDIIEPSEILRSKNLQPIWFDFLGIILFSIGILIFRKRLLFIDSMNDQNVTSHNSN
ncbi:CPBP family intramembrane glutamic endopeptidase [Leptospira montravelensis]|uniref:CPBP family intramembrane glutamic endopeptidase n=1 Tax=Leptospira montravelensis TaxID=2484961 RepID=UPI00143859AF|nr:CPBP family intramembrane glutamic endopeptidase [Leptospira montravelensis]